MILDSFTLIDPFTDPIIPTSFPNSASLHPGHDVCGEGALPVTSHAITLLEKIIKKDGTKMAPYQRMNCLMWFSCPGKRLGKMTPKKLPKVFDDPQALIDHVAEISPWLAEHSVSSFHGGQSAAEQRLSQIDPVNYGKTRNHLDGKVTRLSPYIRHGMLTLNGVRNEALRRCAKPQQIEKFIQELAWRDYWQRIYRKHPEWIWQDVEPYKTGFRASDYADDLPEDLATGHTGVACMDQFIKELLDTGYLHNHARMYVASYTVHWRRVKWQAGAKWFLHHLLDGDPASNNLSWQWVASTFSNKPYIFNLGNVRKYTGTNINTSPEDNRPLDGSYEELSAKLFPKRREVQ